MKDRVRTYSPTSNNDDYFTYIESDKYTLGCADLNFNSQSCGQTDYGALFNHWDNYCTIYKIKELPEVSRGKGGQICSAKGVGCFYNFTHTINSTISINFEFLCCCNSGNGCNSDFLFESFWTS
uniref:Uncharacterized protein n=1 Tax=Acrobeloides nanus TaxID=290746 RepID=A0A914D9H5_9BILA